MIPAGVQIFLALEPVDMRLGFDRLAGLVRERLGYEPRSGALFVFVGKRRQSLKILFHDGGGLCLFTKRPDRGTFALPRAAQEGTTHVEVDDLVLESILDGVVEKPPRKRQAARRVH